MAGPVTTIAWCWKVTRKDAVVFGFTSVDQDLVIGGTTYKAATGFVPSAIESDISMSVANLEVGGILDSDSITEADVLDGRWDAAEVEIFQCNYANLSQGTMTLRTGTIGNITAGTSGFKAEVRGLSQSIQQPVGRVYGAACDANLGDARCKINLAPLTTTAAVTSDVDRRTFSATSIATVDDYYGAGVVSWLTGNNAGLSMEVATFAAAGVVALHLPMPNDIQVGDTFTIVPGCRKRRTEDCKVKFNNVVNFRGFADVPLNDTVLGNATASDN
jgi:uncharacterized phage protein (TIGR02218 family)